MFGFCPVPGTKLLKPLKFSKWRIVFVMLMRQLLESSGGTNQVIRALELGSYTHQTFWEGKRVGDVQSLTASDSINHACVVEPPENPKRMRLRGFPAW